jgi:hypothetical protein
MSKQANRKESAANAIGWTDTIRDQPVVAISAAALTGFFAGGGAMTTPGRFATAIVARMVAREIAVGIAGLVVAGIFADNHDSRRGKAKA